MVITPFLIIASVFTAFKLGRLDFLGLLCFVCYQYEIIYMPKRHFGMASFAPPQDTFMYIYMFLSLISFLYPVLQEPVLQAFSFNTTDTSNTLAKAEDK